MLLFGALLVSPVVPAEEIEAPERIDEWFGRSTMQIPGYSERGDWYGSWWYVNRDLYVGLWIRPGDAGPEMKMQVFRLGGAEFFSTDWSGTADYTSKGGTGTFRLDLLTADENRMEADWLWSLVFSDSHRREAGNVKIYRSGDGRHLIFLMIDAEISIRRHDEEGTAPLNQAWTFRKASRRMITWDEFPF